MALHLALGTSALAAVALPTLIAFNVSPSATFLNQAASFIGWGLFAGVAGLTLPRTGGAASRGLLALLGALAVLCACAVGASLWAAAPWPLSISAVGTLLATALVVAVGAAAARAGVAERLFLPFCIALVVAGVAGSVVGLVQVFAPNLADGDWIAQATPGRATGNLRQPNHLSSLLLWSVAAAVWIGEHGQRRWRGCREAMWILSLLFVEVIVLSASRTGLGGMFVLAGWGLLDRRLSRPTRWLLLLSPLAYLSLWGATTLVTGAMQQSFQGASRMSGSGLYVSYARYKIWANSLSLIAMHPWLGVGFGEFNFAWTLTPFPNRPHDFFDHAHNLFLHFGVELGVPLTLLLSALLGQALWVAGGNAVAEGRAPADAPTTTATRLLQRGPAPAHGPPLQRAAFVMVFMVAVHSMFEYPLWYAYFLLPAAFAFGLCLERPPGTSRAAAFGAEPGNVTRPLVLASLLLALGGSLAVFDYLRVVVIFDPPARAASLDKRIADGRRSIFFGHHADYAAGTVAERPGQVKKAFARATHFLLDTRIMMAWANALQETGEIDKARFVVERLREFRNSASEGFLALCDPANQRLAAAEAAASGLPVPGPYYQCTPPKQTYRFTDFR